MNDLSKNHDSDNTPLTPDDPRLTAIALGELHDPALEAAVAADPCLHAEVARIRELTGALSDALGAESAANVPVPANNVTRFPRSRTVVPSVKARIPWYQVSTALAACLVFAFFVARLSTPDQVMDEGDQIVQLTPVYVAPKEGKSGIDELLPPPPPPPAAEPEVRQAARGEEAKAYSLAVESVSTGGTAGANAAEAGSGSSGEQFTLNPEWELQKAEYEMLGGLPPLEVTAERDLGYGGASRVSATQIRLDMGAQPPTIPSGSDMEAYADDGSSIMKEGLVYEAGISLGNVSDTRLSGLIQDTPVHVSVVSDEFAADTGATSFAGYFANQYPATSTHNREAYDSIVENAFQSPVNDPLSTFSIDVDTASYTNVRRMLGQGLWVPPGAVRIEEFINYFDYAYAPPADKETPFSVDVEATTAPWAPEHQLVRIGLKGYEVPWDERPQCNVVFLVDVSGSMDESNKLPLVQEGLKLLVERLDARDRVAIVTYAGSNRLALPSTTANNTETITAAIDSLSARGGTNGAGGIVAAYQQARRHFVDGGINRVILCTDGDFNVGVTNRSDLTDLIQKEAKSGVFLSIYGFGMGNYQDATLEELSNKGNGNYAYVDSAAEARRAFTQGASGSMITIAKDVKIQVEFNPALVQAYRLIGYENRKLAAQDFNDDTKDAGEIGAGHTVTALYELIPVGVQWQQPGVDPLKYQKVEPKAAKPARDAELLTVKLRYKLPEADTSSLIQRPLLARDVKPFEEASEATRWASSVAAFGMLLRGSDHSGSADLDMVTRIARGALGSKPDPRRTEFVKLVHQARAVLPERDDSVDQG